MKKYSRKLIVVGILVLLLVTLILLQTSKAVCDFFATTVSRYWIMIFGTLFGVLPISFYEWLLIFAILGGIAFIVFVIIFCVKKKWQTLISLTLSVAIGVLSFVNVYSVSASFAYNRSDLPVEIVRAHTSREFSYDDAVDLATKLISGLNDAYLKTAHDESGNVLFPFTFSELNDLLASEYERLTDDYFSEYTTQAKKIINKTIMSELHISGVFFAPFGEANINGNQNNYNLPFTMAHELAHGKGVMRESDANTVAAYLLLTSDNVYLRYSALLNCVSDTIQLVSLYPNSNEKCKELSEMVTSGVYVEMSNYRKEIAQYTALKDLGNFFNNIYLKLNKQEGTSSYVKPSETQGTGKKDDDGEEIVKIINYSNIQNLLIGLYNSNLFD